jgi:hypothetical protein
MEDGRYKMEDGKIQKTWIRAKALSYVTRPFRADQFHYWCVLYERIAILCSKC